MCTRMPMLRWGFMISAGALVAIACASTENLPKEGGYGGGETGGASGASGASGSLGKGGGSGFSGVGASGGFGGTGGTGGTATGGSGGSSATGGSGAVGGSAGSLGTGGGAACATDADCAASTVGKRCDVPTGNCVICLPSDDDCPSGQYCDSTKHCAPGCKSDDECGGGADAGGCATSSCDPATHQCVGCCSDDDCQLGTICEAASADGGVSTCVDGCTATHGCPNGEACCDDGQCYDVTADPLNCGTCGKVCADPPNGTPGCAASACSVASCDAGYADCNKTVADGCESNSATDKANCGACGTVCNAVNGTATCAASKCSFTCNAGFGDCDRNPSNGCEMNTTTNVNNCGACGTRCGTFGGNGSCSSGTCQITCTGDWGDCDGDNDNGCEELLIDRNNCGQCGRVCDPPHGNGYCNAPNCAITSCDSGWNNCDGDAWNGCETNGPC
jgi:hypothetical protein